MYERGIARGALLAAEGGPTEAAPAAAAAALRCSARVRGSRPAITTGAAIGARLLEEELGAAAATGAMASGRNNARGPRAATLGTATGTVGGAAASNGRHNDTGTLARRGKQRATSAGAGRVEGTSSRPSCCMWWRTRTATISCWAPKPS